MTRILVSGILVSLLFVTGCKRLAADASPVVFQPVQVSTPESDAAEPVVAAAADGTLLCRVGESRDEQSR